VRRETGGEEFSHFAGLRSRSPLLAVCMTIFMLSLAGLPPLVGFFGKFYLFTAAVRTGNHYGLLGLVILALAGSLVSLYYYLSVLKAVLVDEPAEEGVAASPAGRCASGERVAVMVLAALVLLLGLFPDALLCQIRESVSSSMPAAAHATVREPGTAARL
jgi:NADH-quinone oxidoreductase subunit N